MTGFSLTITYLYFSKNPESPLTPTQLAYIGATGVVISVILNSIFHDWNQTKLHPVLEAISYMLILMLPIYWSFSIIYFIKGQQAKPQYQMLRQELEKQFAERDKLEMKLHLLQAQIEPHFFFNTLANLHSLIDFEPQKAKLLLEHLTDYLRSSIPLFQKKFIYLEDEIELIRHYLNIQKIRYSDKLRYNISSPRKFRLHPVLPMSILTLVENAIKHGIEKNRGMGKLEVIVSMHKKRKLKISVIDTAGLLNKKPTGTGIINLKSRLNVVYGKNAYLNFYCENNKKTVVDLIIPLDL
ncbi:sensor histidine kinase [Aliikangiella maris]|uniref:Histidine kinase n=2 Tax=Aliikangiella maris TaxID=3162458 RepID=A0ABV2BYW3_9GAMM